MKKIKERIESFLNERNIFFTHGRRKRESFALIPTIEVYWRNFSINGKETPSLSIVFVWIKFAYAFAFTRYKKEDMVNDVYWWS